MIPGFLRVLQAQPPACFVIDEAYCISEWGHDFRPEYRELRRLRTLFPTSRLGAFTATATARVRADILEQLGLQEAAQFQGSFNRPNLRYDVRPKVNGDRQLVEYLRWRRDASGIVYCLSRAATERVAALPTSHGLNAAAYHAGLSDAERTRR